MTTALSMLRTLVATLNASPNGWSRELTAAELYLQSLNLTTLIDDMHQVCVVETVAEFYTSVKTTAFCFGEERAHWACIANGETLYNANEFWREELFNVPEWATHVMWYGS